MALWMFLLQGTLEPEVSAVFFGFPIMQRLASSKIGRRILVGVVCRQRCVASDLQMLLALDWGVCWMCVLFIQEKEEQERLGKAWQGRAEQSSAERGLPKPEHSRENSQQVTEQKHAGSRDNLDNQ